MCSVEDVVTQWAIGSRALSQRRARDRLRLIIYRMYTQKTLVPGKLQRVRMPEMCSMFPLPSARLPHLLPPPRKWANWSQLLPPIQREIETTREEMPISRNILGLFICVYPRSPSARLRTAQVSKLRLKDIRKTLKTTKMFHRHL